MPSQDDVSSLLSDFPPVPAERWRARVEEGGHPADRLDTHSLEGPTVKALYTAEQGEPGPRPPARAPGWSIGLEYRAAEAATLPSVLREDVARGLEAAWIELPAEQRAGAGDAPMGEGLDPAVLMSLVDALGPKTALHLDAGACAPGAIRTLLEHRTKGPADAVFFDPLTTLATLGGLAISLGEAYASLAEATQEVVRRKPPLRTILVDAVPIHDAGASAEQEIAYAIAAGLEHLRQLGRHGLTPAQAMPHVAIRMATGGHLLVEVAKLRAVQRLWARVRAHSRADSGPATPLWVRTSWRASARRDPWVNLLRGSVGGLAAVLGGASVVAIAPFTEALGTPGADARRWAINTQHILRGESYLGVVDDPAAGSWAFEALTDALARSAWNIAQGWLGQGGLAQALLNGLVQAEVAERAATRASALATGKALSTGTNLYPHLDEPTLEVPPVASHEPVDEDEWRVRAPMFERGRPVEPFEALRDRSDVVTGALGRRPRAGLVTVGAPGRARPQLDFARNLVMVGGWEPVVLDPAVEPPDDIGLAIVCAPVKELGEYGPDLVRRLRAGGVTRVLATGRPEDALRDAGVHDFVHPGRDVLTVLSALQTELFPSTPKADA